MNKITMTARIALYGDNGSVKHFIIQLQYEYSEKEYRKVTALNADDIDKGKTCYHYKVTIDEVVYWVPGIYCVEYGGKIGIYNEPAQHGNVIGYNDNLLINKGELERRKFSNEDYAPDVQKQTELMLGRRVTNHYFPDVDKDLAEARRRVAIGKPQSKPGKE